MTCLTGDEFSSCKRKKANSLLSKIVIPQVCPCVECRHWSIDTHHDWPLRRDTGNTKLFGCRSGNSSYITTSALWPPPPADQKLFQLHVVNVLLKQLLLSSCCFSRYSAHIHWLVHCHMTPNNENCFPPKVYERKTLQKLSCPRVTVRCCL